MILPDTDVRLADQWTPWSLFFPFLKMGVNFSFFSQWECHWIAMCSHI